MAKLPTPGGENTDPPPPRLGHTYVPVLLGLFLHVSAYIHTHLEIQL